MINDESIIIASCCRNIGKFTDGFRKNVERIGALFHSYRVVLVENDSTDNTVEKIHAWSAENANVSLIQFPGLAAKLPQRTARIAFCRNAILKHIFSIKDVENTYKYTLMIDSDNIGSSNIYIDAFMSNFRIQETIKWDVLCANVSGRYYDVWALRSSECKVDCWKMMGRYSEQITRNNARNKYIMKFQEPIPQSSPLIEVDSAFGGAGVYKTAILRGCIYIGLDKYKREVCEHVYLHSLIRKKGGRVFINPAFIISDKNEEHVPVVKYTPITENDCKYVSSRGIVKRCFARNTQLVSSSFSIDADILDELYDGATVHICTRAIPNFAANFLPKLTNKIVLVTGDADESIPTYATDVCISILQSPNILHWFTQNCVADDHPKLSHIPIGLDYHTMHASKSSWGAQQTPIEQEDDMDILRKKALPFHQRKIKCYSTFHFFLQRGDRQEAYDNIPKNLIDYEPKQTTRYASHKTQIEYAFVASPYGGGPDCHRTWEALVLGCIPIIKHSKLDRLFDDLPVLLIDKWADVTEELLTKTIDSFKGRQFNYDKLTLNYWMNLIESKST